jgi:drug/metabolite transporter (DMT)-like permease
VLAQHGFGARASLSVRFAVSATVLFVLLAARRVPWRPPAGERLRPVLLGAVGYALQSSLFYSALQRGTAAAVALLFYVYPAIVTVAELSVGKVRATPRLLVALGLSLVGTVLIVVAGSDVDITPTGVAFALAAAVAFGTYLLASDRTTGRRTDPMVNAAWVAAGAALSLATQGAVVGELRSPGSDWWLMVANGVATASAFALLFAALGHLGASRTAVVMTLEAFSAVVLSAVLLGEVVGPIQLAGGAAILAATVLISLTKADSAAPV